MSVKRVGKPHIYFWCGRWTAEIQHVGFPTKENKPEWLAAVAWVEKKNRELEWGISA
jgi:hypothetical protein